MTRLTWTDILLAPIWLPVAAVLWVIYGPIGDWACGGKG